jgi:outer membrane protein assembly factor BamB
VDDDRLLLNLRRIAEPVDPPAAFLDAMYEALAEELGFRGRTSTGAVPARRLPAPAWSGRVRRIAWLAAAALLVLGIMGGAVLIGALFDRRSMPTPLPFSDVTTYRSDAQRSGIQPGPRPSGDPVLIWSAKANGPIQFNPVLASGVLFVGSDDGHLYALDARTGSEHWSFDAGVAIKGSAVAMDGVVAVADADGTLHVVDQATGFERWNAEDISDIGNVSEGILYVPGRDDTVRGYDLQTGAARWSWQAPEPVLYVTVVDDTAYVTAGATLHAVAIADGSERWHFQTAGTQGSLASVAGEQVFVSTRDGPGALTALNRATGSPIWTLPGPRGLIVSLGSIQNGIVYAPTAGAGFFALNAETGQVVWQIAALGSVLRSTPIVDGLVFAPVDDPGGIVALRASDGAIVWRQALGGSMQGWPVVTGGLVFTTDSSGAIHAYGDMVVPAPSGPVTTATSSDGAPSEPASEPSTPPNPATVIATLMPSTTGLSRAADMDIGPDGNLYVVDYRPMVSVISPDGRLIRNWGRAGSGDKEFDFAVPNLDGAAHIAVGRDGLVYVSDGGNRRVQVFTPEGNYLRQFGNRGAEGDPLLVAWDLGVDDGGNVYVIDGGLAALTKFDREGALEWLVGGMGSSDPELKSLGHGVKFDPAGHLWIANDDGGRLIAIDTDGHEVDTFGETGSRPGQFAAPCGLNFDLAGNLYVYNCVGGRIQVFDPQHRLIGLWDGPVDDRRQSFAFAPGDRMYQLGPDDTITVIQIELP